MKIFKKFYLVLLAGFMVCSSNVREVNSLFGNTHFNLGQKIIQNLDTEISETQKNAFLSGLVYADIGRFKFDKEIKVNSDSTQFITEMKKHAKTPEEKWFIRGFEMHILQDQKTIGVLEEVFEYKHKGYKEYIADCALLDCYFLNKNNEYIYSDCINKLNLDQIRENLSQLNIQDFISSICENSNKDLVLLLLNIFYSSIEKKYSLNLYNDLVEKTYTSLGLKLNEENINEQAGNIIASFATLTSLFKYDPALEKEDLASKIELSCDKLVKICVDNLKSQLTDTVNS